MNSVHFQCATSTELFIIGFSSVFYQGKKLGPARQLKHVSAEDTEEQEIRLKLSPSLRKYNDWSTSALR